MKYTFYFKPRDCGSVTIDWNECKTREDWQELCNRISDYVDRSNKIRVRKFESEICGYWCHEMDLKFKEPLPKIKRKPLVPKTKRNKYKSLDELEIQE